LRATSRTMIIFECAEKLPVSASNDHAHATKWLATSPDSQLVIEAIEKELQLDRQLASANYLYADGHVAGISAAQAYEWVEARFDFAKPE
jgi:prepilin-type processing-associated H-X9-DG protein